MTKLKRKDQPVELSTDLATITAEINAYKRVAGEAIFEIGRRLKHVKENDLAHGEFGKWLEEIDIDRTLATRLMKISEEFSGPKYATWHNLSCRVLYEIATLPPEERDREHTLESGETKRPDEIARYASLTGRTDNESKHGNLYTTFYTIMRREHRYYPSKKSTISYLGRFVPTRINTVLNDGKGRELLTIIRRENRVLEARLRRGLQ